MNKSLCRVFINETRPYNTHNRHIKPCLKFGSKLSTLKIWVFQALGSGFRLSPLDRELVLEKNYHVFLQFGKFTLHPIEEINKTQKPFRKQRSLNFQPNFKGRLFMTSMGMLWPYFLKKYPTK